MKIKELVDSKNPTKWVRTIKSGNVKFHGGGGEWLRKGVSIVGLGGETRWTKTGAKLGHYGGQGGKVLLEGLLVLEDKVKGVDEGVEVV